MNSNTATTLVRCVILLGAMGCGVIGYRWYQDEPKDIALDILDYAVGLTRRVDESMATEARLIAEGREEDSFRAFDVRRNSELEWRDIQGELNKYAGASNQQQLVAHDFLTETAALRLDVEKVRKRLTTRVPAYSMLGASLVLLLGVLVVRPSRNESTPEPNFA